MKPLFKLPELQQKFEEDGFVKISLLTPAEVIELTDAYKTVASAHEKINIPYITTSHSNDAELIARVDAILQKVIGPAIKRHLVNYNLLFGNYLVKMPGAGSETAPHQDITFVDESQYVSANIWVALQDTNKENGCMYFLEGSHTFMPTLRPTHSYPWLYENAIGEIKSLSKPFPARAGEAFIFNHAVIHGSFANNTLYPRLAAVIAAYCSDAELLHYFLPEGEKNRVKKYKMSKEAFVHFVKNQPPAKGVFLNEIDYDFKQLSKQEFKAMPNKWNGSVFLLKVISRFFKKQEISA